MRCSTACGPRLSCCRGKSRTSTACTASGLLADLQPQDLPETDLAERIVELAWRLRRAGRYHRAVFEALYEQQAATLAGEADEPDAAERVLGRMLLADFSGPRVLERVQLYERRIESSLARARAEWDQRPAARRGQTEARASRWPAPGVLRAQPGLSGRSRLRPRAVPVQTNPGDHAGRTAQAHGEQTKPMAAAGGRSFGHCLDERSQFRGPDRHPGRPQTPAAPLCGVTQQDRTGQKKREEAVRGAGRWGPSHVP